MKNTIETELLPREFSLVSPFAGITPDSVAHVAWEAHPKTVNDIVWYTEEVWHKKFGVIELVEDTIETVRRIAWSGQICSGIYVDVQTNPSIPHNQKFTDITIVGTAAQEFVGKDSSCDYIRLDRTPGVNGCEDHSHLTIANGGNQEKFLVYHDVILSDKGAEHRKATSKEEQRIKTCMLNLKKKLDTFCMEHNLRKTS